MDHRNHDVPFSGHHASQSSGNFSLHGSQNDQFSSYINSDESPSFDSWPGQAYSGNANNIGYEHHSQAWQQPSYQSPNPLSNFNDQPRGFDQGFSRNPAFSYHTFEQEINPVFGSAHFNNQLGYDSNSQNQRFDYSLPAAYPQSHETVSPQALQNYAGSHPKAQPRPDVVSIPGKISDQLIC